MQRLLKCCMRAALSSAVLELPAKCSRAPRAACGYGALVQRFTARRYSATAGDALTERIAPTRPALAVVCSCRGAGHHDAAAAAAASPAMRPLFSDGAVIIFLWRFHSLPRGLPRPGGGWGRWRRGAPPSRRSRKISDRDSVGSAKNFAGRAAEGIHVSEVRLLSTAPRVFVPSGAGLHPSKYTFALVRNLFIDLRLGC
jgi:hypothetical protein